MDCCVIAGVRWFHTIYAELDRELRIHTQPKAVDMSIYAVLQSHFMSVEQFLHVARGVDKVCTAAERLLVSVQPALANLFSSYPQ